jgi:hypothetical protein
MKSFRYFEILFSFYILYKKNNNIDEYVFLATL